MPLIGTLVLGDLLSLLGAFEFSAYLAALPALGGRATEQYRLFLAIMVPVFLLIFLSQRLYDYQNLLGGLGEFAAVLRSCSYALVAMVLLGFVLRKPVSREWTLLFWGLTTVFVCSTRILLRRVAYGLRHRKGYFIIPTIVIGADATASAIAAQLSRPATGMRVVGVLDDYVPVGTHVGNNLKVLGAPAALPRVAAKLGVSDVIVVPQALPWETIENLMADAAMPNGIRFHISGGLYDLLTTGVRLSEKNHVPLLTVNKANLTPLEGGLKRGMDCALAVVLLLAFTPLLAFSELWLRFHRSHLSLARRRVIGRYGSHFDQLSLLSAAPFRSEFMCKLPGLLNVLRGELSLVGPRPVAADSRPQRRAPLTVRPGLTGLWRQVNDVAEQSVLDLYYIRSYSLWLDLQVLQSRLRRHLGSRSRNGEIAASPREASA